MRTTRTLKSLLASLALGVALLGVSYSALADKLHLNDGRVLDGEIVRQDADFIVFKVDGKNQIFEMSSVKKVEKTDAAKPATPATPAPATTTEPAKAADSSKPAEPAKADGEKGAAPAEKPAPAAGKASRVAILNFGPPNSWNGKVDDMVGVVVSAKAFEDAIPLLDKDKVDTVIVRVKSGGGYGLEVARFSEVFRRYKAKYRLVAWVESAISAAAMSPWNISEFYMMPEGNIGACTGWSGNLVATKGVQLLQMLNQMESLSVEGGRDPKLMRSMQIMDPLSYNIDESGHVTFFQDATSGKHLLNPPGQILTLNAHQAIACKFAVGIAATPEELVKEMGLTEVEWAGKDASKLVDDFMIQAHKIDKQVGELAVQYRLALGAAQQLSARGDDPRFAVELGKARQYLAQIRKWVGVNPNFRFHLAQGFGAELTDEWFNQQEELLRTLAQRAREAGQRGR